MTTIKQLLQNSAGLVDNAKTVNRLMDIKKNGLEPGLSTGWGTFDKYFQFPPFGQLTTVTGVPGAGKSAWVDSMAVSMAARHGWNIFYYSPENFPAEYHFQKLMELFIGKPVFDNYNHKDNCTEDDFKSFNEFVQKRFTFVDCDKMASIEQIVNSIKLQAIESRAKMLILDPFNKLEMKLDIRENETKWIGRMLTGLQLFARENNMHVFIVAHPAKPVKTKDGGYNPVTLYDISGSAHFYNMSDNGFVLHRSWEDKTGDGNLTEVRIAKIKDRRYGKCGECNFRFEPATGRFSAVEHN